MRKYLTTAMAIALMSGTSFADLQNIEVGASLRTRANSTFDSGHNDTNAASQFTEARTDINIDADLSDEVSAHITLQNYGTWGDGGGTVGLYESYITLGDAVAGFDLNIGRQEVLLGSEFLVGNENTAGGFSGRSYDGIVATTATDMFDLTLLSLKVSENDAGATLTDADTDLHGIYATYNGLEDHSIDGYVLYRRIGVPTADNDELYTYGVRATGGYNSFDYEVEIALQDGDQSATVDYEGTAINAEVGYTFDSNMQPRVFLGAAQFSGADKADEAGFQRMYSDWEYSEFLGDGDMSNVLILRAGVSANATEKIGVSAVISTFELDEELAAAGNYNNVTAISANDDDLGTEIGLYATYQYSEDVALEVGAAQFLNGDAIDDGNTPNDEDPTYVYAEISLSF